MEQKEQALRAELSELEGRLSDPDIFSSKEYPKLAKRRQMLEEIVGLFHEMHTLKDQITQAQELADGGGELSELALEELRDLERRRLSVQQALESALTPKDPNDERDVVIEIRAAAGGDEASLFAGDLYRMYI